MTRVCLGSRICTFYFRLNAREPHKGAGIQFHRHYNIIMIRKTIIIAETPRIPFIVDASDPDS